MGGADAVTGRYTVRMVDASPNEPDRTVYRALLPTNLMNTASEAISAVFSDRDLLLSILTYIKRWERAGVLSGVSSEWRHCVWCDPDLYRSIVLLAVPPEALQPIAPWNANPHEDAYEKSGAYGARKFMEEGALPMLPAGAHPCCLNHIPNTAWVEHLFVEFPLPSYRAALNHVLALNFPALMTLMLHGLGHHIRFCHQIDGYSEDEAIFRKTIEWRVWLGQHMPTLKNVHFDMSGDDVMNMAENSGLESVQFFDIIAWGRDVRSELEVVKGWTSEVRSKLTALSMYAQPPLEDVKQIIELLPNLRRLGWIAPSEWPDYNGALTCKLSPAIENSNIEALYIKFERAASLPSWAFDTFGRPSKLKEIVVYFDSPSEPCFHFFYAKGHGAATYHGPATSADAMYFLQRSLPLATALILDKDSDVLPWRRGPGIMQFPDPLHRVLLPTTREDWHRASGTQGLNYLPF